MKHRVDTVNTGSDLATASVPSPIGIW